MVSLCAPEFVVIFQGFSDSDLEGIVDDGYSPDKKKGREGLWAGWCPQHGAETATPQGPQRASPHGRGTPQWV